MNLSVKLFATTLVISFFGSLPLGTLNVSLTHLAFQNGARAAFLFGLGAILIEVLLVRLAVEAVGRLQQFRAWWKWLEYGALLVLLAFAGVMLIEAVEMKGFQSAVPLPGAGPFVLGLLLSTLNPLHLPFWLGWTAALKAKGVLPSTNTGYNVFVAAIAAGTSAAFVLYAWAGIYLIHLLEGKQYLLNWAAGLTLLTTAAWQIWKRWLVQS